MPGNRLTLHERQQIESAMAGGLGYAEIARRLARPASTISREVNRNGGHNHYRAQQAHEGAGQRAHRTTARASSSEPVPNATPDTDGPTELAMREVELRLIEMMSDAGLPRMMAMVLVTLMLSEHGTLTAGELAAHLHVSPASISKAIRHLEHLKFARRERLPGARRERYALDEDMWAGIWAARAETIRTWGITVAEAAALIGTTTPAGARLDQMSLFLAFMHDEMVHATDRWSGRRAPESGCGRCSSGGSATEACAEDADPAHA